MNLQSKLVGETITVVFDFGAFLEFNETISLPVISVEVFSGVDAAPENMISGSAVALIDKVSQHFTAGEPGVNYTLICSVTGSTGTTYQINQLLAVLATDGSFAPVRDLSISGSIAGPSCIDEAVNFQLTIVGGYPPFSVEISDGELPDGWSLGVSGRLIAITGSTPTSGTWSFTIQVTDFVGQTATYEVTDLVTEACAESTLVYVVNGGTGRVEHYAIPGFANVGDSIVAAPAGNISIICGNSDKSTLFISSPDFDYIAFLNVATNSVDQWIDTGVFPNFASPLGIVVSPDDLYLYATCVDSASGSYAVDKFNIADPTIMEDQHIYDPLVYLGRGEICVNRDGTFVYPTTFLTQQVNKLSDSLSLQDSHQFTDDPLNQEPVSSVYLRGLDGNDYVCTVPAQGTYPQVLYFLNPSTLDVEYQVSLTGAQGNGSMCFLPNRTKMYVCGNISENVSVVDMSTFPPTLLTTITTPVGSRPRRCCSSAQGGYVFVTDASLNQFYVIDPATDTITNTIATGAGGNGVICL